MVLIPSVSLYAQNTKDYYFEIKEGYELGEIQKALNSDHSLTLSMGNSELVNDLNCTGNHHQI